MNLQDKETLVKLSVEKAETALNSASENLKNNELDTALNRNYYAIFYSVLGLGYNADFVTSKHSTLMGWFNKKFIYEEKIFDSKMIEIYSKAFERRQKSDYDITYKPTYDAVDKLIKQSSYFINNVINYLKLN